MKLAQYGDSMRCLSRIPYLHTGYDNYRELYKNCERSRLTINQKEISMSIVTILTSATCSYCVAAKNLLKKHEIKYQEVDLIKGGDQAKQLLLNSGQRTVPQIFIDEKSIGGFTELNHLMSQKDFEINQLNTL